ncbi:hypothetical protein [Mesorhizobium abyssinicae]|uniref:hypothetical protein n=1 Tax=Mesorhizobium abyssinicae TaxID=1209958 RepID=UPI0033961233
METREFVSIYAQPTIVAFKKPDVHNFVCSGLAECIVPTRRAKQPIASTLRRTSKFRIGMDAGRK